MPSAAIEYGSNYGKQITAAQGVEILSIHFPSPRVITVTLGLANPPVYPAVGPSQAFRVKISAGCYGCRRSTVADLGPAGITFTVCVDSLLITAGRQPGGGTTAPDVIVAWGFGARSTDDSMTPRYTSDMLAIGNGAFGQWQVAQDAETAVGVAPQAPLPIGMVAFQVLTGEPIASAAGITVSQFQAGGTAMSAQLVNSTLLPVGHPVTLVSGLTSLIRVTNNDGILHNFTILALVAV